MTKKRRPQCHAEPLVVYTRAPDMWAAQCHAWDPDYSSEFPNGLPPNLDEIDGSLYRVTITARPVRRPASRKTGGRS
jgi:hypothetical protein